VPAPTQKRFLITFLVATVIVGCAAGGALLWRAAPGRPPEGPALAAGGGAAQRPAGGPGLGDSAAATTGTAARVAERIPAADPADRSGGRATRPAESSSSLFEERLAEIEGLAASLSFWKFPSLR
jgi:hypothetical protein